MVVGKAPTIAHAELFAAAWALYPKRPGNNKKAAAEAWNARIKEGVPPEDMLEGVQAYAKYLKACPPSSPNYIKQAATFFGPKHFFYDDWDAPEVQPETKKNDPAAGLMKFYQEERLV